MTADRQQSVGDKANHVAESFKSHNPGALNDLHNDLKGMSQGQRKEFFHKLQGATNGQHLPGLDISEDKDHHLKVTEKVHGKSHTLYDETTKHNRHQGDTQPKPSPEAGQKPEPGQKPDDASKPKQDSDFTGGLRKGEGPYQALHRQHPDWDHKKLMDESHKIKQQLGKEQFTQGEQFRTNADGSVSTRTTGTDGNYNQETKKDGKVTETRSGDANGNFQSQSFDANGQKTGSLEHKVTPDGYTETQKDADGKTTSQVTADKTGKNTDTFDKDGNKTSSMRENNDGSVVGWKKNADGTQTNIDQPDANHKTETTTKDGKVISTKTHEQTADGSKDVIEDEKGKNTNIYDKDGNQLSSMRENNDGSAIGWKKNADGTLTSIDQPDQNHRTETTTKDGQVVNTMTHEKTATGSTDVTTDKDGKLTKTYDAQGNQTSGIKQNADSSSTGWVKDKDGNVTHSDTDKNGREESMTFDKNGHLKKTEWHDKTGQYQTQEQIGDYIKTTGMKPTKFGGLGTYSHMELGTLKGPDA